MCIYYRDEVTKFQNIWHSPINAMLCMYVRCLKFIKLTIPQVYLANTSQQENCLQWHPMRSIGQRLQLPWVEMAPINCPCIAVHSLQYWTRHRKLTKVHFISTFPHLASHLPVHHRNHNCWTLLAAPKCNREFLFYLVRYRRVVKLNTNSCFHVLF